MVRTLQNAITSGRIAHGYLFTGTRGTAKTTIARLLAKALNCRSGQGPVAEPCNQCDACKAITAGGHVDVVEMDAASHRGVADIEEVRKNVGYGPMELRYKVFIIDEAHQLSSDAKDAFLKTLEEPPPGVVFILATTEPQAIPITIRSRCQQFDFKRGSLAEISGRLKHVLSAEDVSFTDEAVSLVARGAEGSYRDSLSLLEQVLAFSPESIDAESVQTVLGTLDKETLSAVVNTVAHRDAPGAFALAGQILDSGKEARTLIKTLAAHFRDLLLVRVGGPAAASELTPEDVKALQPQAANFDPAQILKAIEVLNEAFSETRWNNQHRLLTELTFLKLMNLGEGAAAPLATAPIVFNTIAPVASAPAPVPSPARETPPVAPVSLATPASKPPPPVMAEPERESPAPSSTSSTPITGGGGSLLSDESGIPEELDAAYFADEETDSDSEIEMEGSNDEGIEVEPEIIAPLDLELDDELPPPPTEPQEYNDGMALFGEDEDPYSGAVTGGADPEPEVEPEPKVVQEPVRAVELPTEAVKPEPVAAPTPQPKIVAQEEEPPPYTLDVVQRAWPHVLAQAKEVSQKASVQMASAFPSSLEGRTVVLTFSSPSSHGMMNQPKQLEFVRKLLAMVLDCGESVPVRLELKEEDSTLAMKFERPAEKVKVRHDPLEKLKALRSGESIAPAPQARYESSQPQPARVAERPASFTPRSESAPPTTPASVAPNPWAIRHDEPLRGPKEDPAAKARKEQALAEPLVQDALEVFGGEIIVD